MRDSRERRGLGSPSPGPPPRLGAALARFMLASLAAFAVIAVGGWLALRQVALDQAVRETRQRVVAAGRVVESAGLSDGVLHGDPRALRRLDDLVLGQVLGDPVVRVKLWSRDGTILYADAPQLIGARYALGADERELFATGGADAEVSDLSKPENRFERSQGKLLEAYTTIRAPDGTPVLFELYERYDAVRANAARLLRGARSRPSCTTASCSSSRASRSGSRRSPTRPRGAATPPRPTRCATRVGSCARACATCARCWWRSTRRSSSPPASTRPSATC